MAANEANPALRLTMLTAIVAVLFVALFGRLWSLQVLAGDRYEALANTNNVRIVTIEAPRGRILDADGLELVKNRPALTISGDRNVLLNALGEPRSDEADATLDRLAMLLDMPRADIVERLISVKYSPFRARPIAFDVTPEVVLAIREQQDLFPGVIAESLPLREYPQGVVASHVLGYVTEIPQTMLDEPAFIDYRPGDVVGRAGVESSYEQFLQGERGRRTLQVNRENQVLGVLGEEPPVAGNDLVLTVDSVLQQQVESILEEGIIESRTEIHRSSGQFLASPAGAAVVLDPNSGAVLAMASYPDYDPSQFVGGLSPEYATFLYPQVDKGDPETNQPDLNRVIQSAQSPGSTWKIVSGLAGMRTGQITPESTVDCPGVWGEFNKRNWNPRNEGRMDLSTALMRSCDTFFYELSFNAWLKERRDEIAGNEVVESFQEVAREFGFDDALGIDLPSERGGVVPGRVYKEEVWAANKDRWCAQIEEYPPGTEVRAILTENCNEGYVWRGGDAVNIAIGQGELTVTPLQLASAYGVIANGGRLMQPHVAAEVRAPNGDLVERIAPDPIRTVEMSPDQLAEIRRGLENVVMASRGTAGSAFAGFPLGDIPVAGKTGTSENCCNKVPSSWFAAYAPANAPEVVVVVMVEEGGGGSQTSAPIARRILEAYNGLPISPFRAGAAIED